MNTMNRLFGTAAPKVPKPNLAQAIAGVDERIASVDVKIASLNAELATYTSKLSKMRDGTETKRKLKEKAKLVLQRRLQHEGQRRQLQQQVDNMERARTMQDNLKYTMVTVDALKTTTKQLKKEYGKVDVDRIERLQDEMADLLDVGDEIQESLARSYDVPEDVDELELDAELEALGADMELEGQISAAEGALPSFMQEVPDFIDEAPATTGKVKEVAG